VLAKERQAQRDAKTKKRSAKRKQLKDKANWELSMRAQPQVKVKVRE